MSHTLLLADDSATIQRVVELTFANEDIDVVTVGDGTRAIEAIERDDPDIVLADVSMPGRNGYEVASFVRSAPARARIPVVLLTGAFEPLDEARCGAIGRHEVLVKPFEPRAVIGKVRELLDLPAADVPEAVGAADALAADASEADVLEAPAAGGAAAPGAEAAAERSGPVAAPAAETASGPSESVDPPAVGAAPGAPAHVPPESPQATDYLRLSAPDVPVGDPPAGAGGSVLAQAFVTFLAVEQGAAPPAVAVSDTGGDSGGAGSELPLTDAMMDALVKRVVDRLTGTVLRDTVAEVVSRIAERLAREEITRVAPGGE